MSYTLFDLSQNYVDLFDSIDDPDITEQALQDTLEALDGAIEVKVSNGIGLIKSLQNLEDGISSEISRLAARKKTVQNRIQYIKDWYKQNLETMQTSKVQTPRGTMAIVKNPSSLVIDNPEDIPDQFKIPIPATFELDKSKIKDALKTGDLITGAHLEQGTSLRIR